jgi:hypothetical protein
VSVTLQHCGAWLISPGDRLIKPSEDDEAEPNHGHKFYHNSIEHLVNELKEQKARNNGARYHAAWHDNTDDDDYSSDDIPGTSEPSFPIERLNFQMWVSSPINRSIVHSYTVLKAGRLPSTPLEDLPGWRLQYPRLKTLVDDGKHLRSFDLVHLDTCFKLMENFPPPHSQLGINLELEFPAPPPGSEIKFDQWSCKTYMYREGVLLSTNVQQKCAVFDQWTVRPFFESKWWAKTFTTLIEDRKSAEGSKDPAAMGLAEQKFRDFFRGLSIMQEITADRYHVPPEFGYMKRDGRKKMAILLWKFSLAPEDRVGTTTWQNLIPPPDRMTTNSPQPVGAEMDLPHLSMDSVVSPGNGVFDANHSFMPQYGMNYEYDGMDEELCHDGFTVLKSENFEHMEPLFDVSMVQDFAGDESLAHQTPQSNENAHPTPNTNLFDLSQTQSIDAAGHFLDIHGHRPSTGSQVESEHPLSRFDASTHQALQDQLNAGTGYQREQGRSASSSYVKSEQRSPTITKVERTWSQQPKEDERTLQYLAMAQQQHRGEPASNGVKSLLHMQLHNQKICDVQMQQRLILQQQQNERNCMPAQEQQHSSWSPSLQTDPDSDEALRFALLAASAMNDLGHQATPRAVYNQERKHSKDDQHYLSPLPIRPPMQSFHSFPSMRSDEYLHHDHELGISHAQHDLSLCQPPLSSSDQHMNDTQLSAISAPPDFMHAHDDVIDRGSAHRNLSRAHSEPDPTTLDAMHDFSPNDFHPSHGNIDTGDSQSTLILHTEDLGLHGSFDDCGIPLGSSRPM